ncbi:MAG: hypothetical protein P8045_16430 [Candidatus Thiodiazotropha sp.]
MKKPITIYAIAAFLLLCLSPAAFAGKGQGAGDGSGPLLVNTVVSNFTYDGVITSAGVPGDGIEISTADGPVTVYGMGPSYYWASLGLDKLETLAIGASVSVTGIVVELNGELRNLATTITVDGLTLDLRDPVTTTPLWR